MQPHRATYSTKGIFLAVLDETQTAISCLHLEGMYELQTEKLNRSEVKMYSFSSQFCNLRSHFDECMNPTAK